MGIWKQTMPFNWLYIFSAWDTAYYHDIALSWYPAGLSPYWAFWPLYPATIRLLILIGVDSWLGGFIISSICGLLAVVAFQKVAESHFPRSTAIALSLTYFLLPPVFVFSGVSYTEPMFLLLSLATWLLHLRRSDFAASLTAALTALTRPYGILIIVPLAYDYLKRGHTRSIAYLAIPIVTLSAWIFYGYAMTHTWLVSRLSSHIFWYTANALRIRTDLIRFLMGDTTALPSILPYIGIGIMALALAALVTFSAIRIWSVDRALSLYVCISVLAIVYFGYFVGWRSLPRYLAAIFPIGLSLQIKRRWVLWPTLIVLAVLDYFAWLAFLTDGLY